MVNAKHLTNAECCTGTLRWSVSEKKGGAASSPVDLCLGIGKNLFITKLVSRFWISYFETEIHWAQGARAESVVTEKLWLTAGGTVRGLDDERVRLREIQTISVASGRPLCLYTWVRVEGNASASSASRNHAPWTCHCQRVGHVVAL